MPWPQDVRGLVRGLHLALRAGLARLSGAPGAVPTTDRSFLIDIPDFGPNPGGLTMRVFIPPRPRALAASRAPLVVVLHGCGQQAAFFAECSGWCAWAERLGLVLILPEQQPANHRGRCFRWFDATQTARNQGEAGSIRAMIGTAQSRFGTDPHAVFVVGLSAGGAMAAALLAAYPDIFAAGAVVAGLPVGAANGATQALLRMAHADTKTSQTVDLARGAAPSGFAGPWPRLSIWAGAMDRTVDPVNATMLACQWRGLHGNAARLEQQELLRSGVLHQSWGSVVELWTLPALAHAYPIGPEAGQAAPFVVPTGLSATLQILAFWRLLRT